MSGLLSTFNIAKRGMSTHQTALQVVSHNVANANTEGYSVQRANIQTSYPADMPSLNSAAGPGQLGTGSEVSSIMRSRDEFLDNQIRKESSTSSKYQSRDEFLSEIESIFNEPSTTGISSNMSKFFDAWNALSTNPESPQARTLVATNAQTLSDSINHSYQQLEDLQANSSEILKQQTFQVSNILSQINDLNSQIKAIAVGHETPNDLMDKRDLLLDQLSKNFSFDINKTSYDGISLSAKVNGQSIKMLSSDGGNNLNLAYVNSIKYYIDPSKTGGADVSVVSHDGSYNPQTIGVYGIDMDLNSGNIPGTASGSNSIRVGGVELSDDNKTVKLGDGNIVSMTDKNNMAIYNNSSNKTTINTSVSGGSIQVTVTSPTGVVTTMTPDSSNCVTVQGIKIQLDGSGNITKYSDNGNDVNVNSSGNVSVNTNGYSVSNNSGTITLTNNLSGGTTVLNESNMTVSNLKSSVELYMNGDQNQILTIKDIDVNNSYGQAYIQGLSSTHTVFYNSDEYDQLKGSQGSFNKTYDYSSDTSVVGPLGIQAVSFDNGSLNGYESINDEIENYKTQLNNTARVLAISVNTIHSDNDNSIDFFDSAAESDPEPAKVISVNQTIMNDVSKINAGKTIPGNAGNGDRALLLSQLRNTRMDILTIHDRASFTNNVNLSLTNMTMQSSSSGSTIDGYYKDTISALGVSGQQAKTMVSNQESLINQLTTRRDSISGVSLDEEMTNMIQFQKGYEANAKIVSVLDQLLDVVVNGLIK